MKDIIYYYYNIFVDKIDEYNNVYSFLYDGYIYYFKYFNRLTSELYDILQINEELKNNNYNIYDIILNKNNEYLTKVGDNNYILMRKTFINEQIDIDDIYNESLKLATNNKSVLLRNNWSLLWSEKIDYYENQLNELNNYNDILIDSITYYIGLSENAISYFNKIIKKYDMNTDLYLQHRRIKYPCDKDNFYDPINYIIDTKIRDISEYIKEKFFKENDSFDDLSYFLKTNRLSNKEYNLLFVRLLYPSYFFDVYDKVINNSENIESLNIYVNKINEYEKFLKKAYIEINKYSFIEEIYWITKKEL